MASVHDSILQITLPPPVEVIHAFPQYVIGINGVMEVASYNCHEPDLQQSTRLAMPAFVYLTSSSVPTTTSPFLNRAPFLIILMLMLNQEWSFTIF